MRVIDIAPACLAYTLLLSACSDNASSGTPRGSGGSTGGASGSSTSTGSSSGTTSSGSIGGSTGSSSGSGSSWGGSGSSGGTGSGRPGDGGSCIGTGVAVPAGERISNGNPLLPPKWAFGVLWGSYYDQTGSTYAQGGSILDAAKRVRAEYSGDLMWIDSSWLWHDYSGAGAPHYISFTFDPSVFPDPGSMIQTLRQEHFHFGVWEWPWADHGVSYFADALAKKYFIMKGTQPALASGGWHGDPNPASFDFTNPATETWWTGLNKPLADLGLDFLKLDTNTTQENSPLTSGGGTLFDKSKSWQHERNRVAYETTKLYPAAHNADAMMNGARGFIMPKVESPANDQLPGWWTDDTQTTFAGMQTEMGRASQLNTPITAAYWCGDTGGHLGNPDDELYIRWLEYSSFTPLQEFFGSKTNGVLARFPWLYGIPAQQILKQYTDLRYRLLPFRYSNAIRAYEVTPVSYPVSWIGSTHLLVGSGDSQLLVQPITTKGATSATVSFPSGANWIHYVTAASYPGGKSATVAAPLDQEPVFVKAGSIVPMGPSLRYVDEVPADPLTLDIYPAGSTSYTLYEDDGISEGYLGGAYSTTKFSSDTTSGHVVVAIGAQATAKYAYSGQLSCRTYVLKMNGQASAPAMVIRDGNPEPMSSSTAFAAAAEGWYYDSAAHVVWVKFPLQSSAATNVSLH